MKIKEDITSYDNYVKSDLYDCRVSFLVGSSVFFFLMVVQQLFVILVFT